MTLIRAGLLRRAAALAIDLVLLVAVDVSLAVVVVLLSAADTVTVARVGPVSSAIAWAYFSLLESSAAQATVGKLAMGLKVVDLDGAPISFRRASARYWLKMLSTLTLLGWAMAAIPPGRRALHDLLSGTAVVRDRVVQAAPNHWDPALGTLQEYWDGSRWVKAAVGPEYASQLGTANSGR
jgi:uncharacterized RDD family membrane protein YckC